MRLQNPILSPPNVSQLMQSCWLADPTERPSFSKVKEVIFKELELDVEEGRSLKDYLSLLELEPGKMTYNTIRASNYHASRENDQMGQRLREFKTTEADDDEIRVSVDKNMDENESTYRIQKRCTRINSLVHETLPFIDEDLSSSNTDS